MATEKNIYESKTSYDAWLVFSYTIAPLFSGMVVLSVNYIFQLPIQLFFILLLLLTVLFSYIIAIFTWEKYFFYETYLEIVKPLNKKNYFNKHLIAINYKDLQNAFFMQFKSKGLTSMIVLKDYKGRKIELKITNEKIAKFILEELKKCNVPVTLKTKSVYSKK